MARACSNTMKFGSAAILIAMVMAIVVNSNVVAASRQYPGGRSLLQSHGALLIDYMGASGDTSLQFSDLQATVSAFPTLDFIFPLSFAIDADASGNTQNGVFSPYWSTSLDGASAQAFKQQNPNVKLMVSLAGFSQFVNGNTQNVNWYDPASTTDWVNNAVSSITSLVSTYSLDGVDVDYENFPSGSATFTTCIGQLISNLKSAGTISVASIAPFGSTSSIYADLFSNYGSSIDYVNYQFYADGLNTQSDYVNDFNTVSASFDPAKLLASVEVNGRGLQGNDFIAAAQQLSIAGVMIFDVDNSKSSNFALEQSVATFLTS
jgi:hypothetical protein